MTTEKLSGLGDLVIGRLQQAFAHEEPATDLATIVERAGRYRAGQPPGAPERGADPLGRLSPREREILGMMASGWSNRRIANACVVSLYAVQVHTENLLAKLGVQTKLEAVALALEHGWTPVGDVPEMPAFKPLDGARLHAMLQELSPDQREVLVLRMTGGLTAPEVAAVLGKTTGAVKALQHRGLASLARLLVSRGEDPS
jgi:DNA-binding CsgD family transcriptional regulator